VPKKKLRPFRSSAIPEFFYPIDAANRGGDGVKEILNLGITEQPDGQAG
jgi:hypothetical protein